MMRDQGNMMIVGDSLNEQYFEVFRNMIVNISREEGLLGSGISSKEQCQYVETVYESSHRYMIPVNGVNEQSGRIKRNFSITSMLCDCDVYVMLLLFVTYV